MNRRTYLAVLSAATAGCAGRLDVSASSGPTPDGDPPAGAQRGVTVAAIDDAGAEHDVAIDVEVVEPWVTPDHPAEVRVTTTNEGRRRDVSISEGMCCLFDRSGGESHPSGIWLHRAGTAEHIDRPDGRWTRDAPSDKSRAYSMYGCLPYTFEAGESVTNAYQVWNDYQVDGYYPPGTYRFAEPVTVLEPGGDFDDEADVLAEFLWGFSLQVVEP